MKTKKHIIQITVLLALISLIIFTIIQLHLYPACLGKCVADLYGRDMGDLKQYFTTIFGGIFTGAFTTLFITYREYQDEKEKTLIDYYLISRDFLKNFYGIEYLRFVHPTELVIGCIFEEADNKNKLQENEDLRKILYRDGKNKKSKKIYRQKSQKISYNEKNKLKQFIWEHLDNNTRLSLYEQDEKEIYLDNEYNKIMSDYYDKINKVMEQYVKISKLTYKDVETAYAHIDFLLLNDCIRKRLIYEQIHSKQRELLKFIRKKSEHFKNIEKNNNLPAMINVIIEIQNRIFGKEEIELGYSIYNNYFLEIDTQLYELLKVVYGKNYKGDKPDKSEVHVCSLIMPEKIQVWEEEHKKNDEI